MDKICDIFPKTVFFSCGSNFSLLGVIYEDQNMYNNLCTYFFHCTILLRLYAKLYIINDKYFYRAKEDRYKRFFLLFLSELSYNLLLLNALIGILSNIGFFMSAATGFIIGEIFLMFIDMLKDKIDQEKKKKKD